MSPLFPETFRPLEGIVPLNRFLFPGLLPILPRPVRIRILFVCEGLSFDEPSGFSFKILIDTLRNDTAVRYANFQITLATWAGSPGSAMTKNAAPGFYEATYNNFRFSKLDPDDNELVLNKFDEVWLFGLNPSSDFASPRADILASPVCPTRDDLIALTRWMNQGGGVLAMGDHASLGAHLCARIPRVWTMRKWTREDGAPPRASADRIDTNRPMSPLQNPTQTNPPAQIPFEAQSDAVPQTIELHQYFRFRRFEISHRPHPVLCAGRLGSIDVMPDHPHEGIINDTSAINLGADILVDNPPNDLLAKEYPTVSGIQPKPEVIAWGNTLPAPPYMPEKGPSPAKRFGLIGTYDGHRAALGRVLVDSTWHHWMSINLSGAYADGDPATPGLQPLTGLMETNSVAYKKILTYYRNVAVWLASSSLQQRMLNYVAFWSALSQYTFEEWTPTSPALSLGRDVTGVLSRSISPCTVSRWLLDLVLPRFEPPFEWPDPRFDPEDPFGPVCLTCPPTDDLESLAMGVLMQEAMKLRDRIAADPKKVIAMKGEDMEAELQSMLSRTRTLTQRIIGQRLEREMKAMSQRIKALAG